MYCPALLSLSFFSYPFDICWTQEEDDVFDEEDGLPEEGEDIFLVIQVWDESESVENL